MIFEHRSYIISCVPRIDDTSTTLEPSGAERVSTPPSEPPRERFGDTLAPAQRRGRGLGRRPREKAATLEQAPLEREKEDERAPPPAREREQTVRARARVCQTLPSTQAHLKDS